MNEGERIMRLVDGDTVTDNTIKAFEEIAPDFSRYLVDFAFGEIYARDGDLKHREIVAIAALATMGLDHQLETHVHGAFNVGLSQEEVVECVMTLIPYIGFPRALNAMRVLKRVIEKRAAKE
jgi:4-carboxymuconolactone decarboxylase